MNRIAHLSVFLFALATNAACEQPRQTAPVAPDNQSSLPATDNARPQPLSYGPAPLPMVVPGRRRDSGELAQLTAMAEHFAEYAHLERRNGREAGYQIRATRAVATGYLGLVVHCGYERDRLDHGGPGVSGYANRLWRVIRTIQAEPGSPDGTQPEIASARALYLESVRDLEDARIAAAMSAPIPQDVRARFHELAAIAERYAEEAGYASSLEDRIAMIQLGYDRSLAALILYHRWTSLDTESDRHHEIARCERIQASLRHLQALDGAPSLEDAPRYSDYLKTGQGHGD